MLLQSSFYIIYDVFSLRLLEESLVVFYLFFYVEFIEDAYIGVGCLLKYGLQKRKYLNWAKYEIHKRVNKSQCWF